MKQLLTTNNISKSLPIVLASFLVLLAGAFFFASPVSALTVSPPTAEFLLTPGKAHASKIKLFNEEQGVVELYAEVVPFGAQGEDGTPSFDFDAEKIGFSSWIQIATDPIILEPGQSAEVPVVINPPETAPPGGHYAAIFFSEQAPEADPTAGGQVTIGSKVGTLYLARVSGEIIEQGLIAEFNATKSVYNRLPVDFEIRFQNSGNTHMRPSGSIAINNLFGGTSGAVDVNLIKGATLPNQTRKYEATWENEAPAVVEDGAWASFWHEFSNERNNFGLGRYKATVILTAGTETPQTYQAETTFWVLPWRLLLVTVLALLVIVLLLVFGIKKYNTWIIAKSKGAISSQQKPKKSARDKS